MSSDLRADGSEGHEANDVVSIQTLAKEALRKKFVAATGVEPDTKGYVRLPQENLVPGLDFDSIQNDLVGGDGNELGTGKFRAVHSSCALAVNSFGPFKTNPENLTLLGKQGASRLEFEHPLPIFRGGTPPNLDVWIEREGEVLAWSPSCWSI